MKTEELRKKDEKDLKNMVKDLRKKLSDIRFRFASNQLKNVKEASAAKKEIARILTLLKENRPA